MFFIRALVALTFVTVNIALRDVFLRYITTTTDCTQKFIVFRAPMYIYSSILFTFRTLIFFFCSVFVVKQSQEPGWLEGTLNGKTGLIPENYVEMLP